MNSADFETFNAAVTLARSGRKADAYMQLKMLQHHYPQDVKLLLWIAFTTPSLEEARQAVLLAGQLEANSAQVQQAKEWLNAELSRQPLTQPMPNLPNSTTTQLSVPAMQTPLPQLYNPAQIYAPPPAPIAYTPPMPYTVQVQPIQKRKMPVWAWVTGGAVVVAILALLLVVQLLQPARNGSGYAVYSSPDDIFHNTGVGQRVQFFGTIKQVPGVTNDGFTYYGWYASANEAPEVLIRFPNGKGLTVATGNATYYVQIVDRRTTDVIAEIQDVKP